MAKQVAVPSTKTEYTEINDIKDDIESLKNNVIQLTHQLKESGIQQTKAFKKTASVQFSELKDNGQKQMEKVESHVREKPAQSIAAAFAVGVIASLLLGRR